MVVVVVVDLLVLVLLVLWIQNIWPSEGHPPIFQDRLRCWLERLFSNLVKHEFFVKGRRCNS